MKRKLLSLLLAFCLVATMMPAMTTTVFAGTFKEMSLDIEAAAGKTISSTAYKWDSNRYNVELFKAYAYNGTKEVECKDSDTYQAGTKYHLEFNYATEEQTTDTFNYIKSSGGTLYADVKIAIKLNGNDLYTLQSLDDNGKIVKTDGVFAADFVPWGNPKAMSVNVYFTIPEIPVESIAMDTTNVKIAVDDKYPLTVSITPSNATNQAVKWASLQPTIASVSSSGVVVGKKVGKALVTVTRAGKKPDKKTGKIKPDAYCEVTVVAKTTAVTGVTLDKSSLELEEGKTETIKATVEPADAVNKAVTWKSSDTNIATVSADGVVKAVKEGTAQITVTTADGGKSATCEVKIKKANKQVTGVTLDQSSLKLEKGKTAALKAVIAPADAANQNVKWLSSMPAVATVSADGVVTAVKEGTATITVVTEDGSKSATCEITVVSGAEPAAPDSGIIDPATGKEVYTTFDGSDMKLEYTTAAYNGSYKKPEVYIRNTAGASLTKGTDYTLEYYNNKTVGKATVIVRGMGAYEGVTAGAVFTIKPKAVTVKSVKKPASKKLTVKWGSHKTQTTGFQVRYATTKSFKSGTYKTVTIKSKSATSKTLTKLKKGKKYYVKVRAYKTVDGKKIYSSWSKVKSAKA